jgi:flagellar hook-basal body complex protein FliE
MDKIAPLGLAFTEALQPRMLALRAGASGIKEGGFGAAMRDALNSVDAGQNKADDLQRKFQLGDPNVSIEETMLATQSASISFQGLVQVRNRLVSAYHDIMNMQV